MYATIHTGSFGDIKSGIAHIARRVPKCTGVELALATCFRMSTMACHYALVKCSDSYQNESPTLRLPPPEPYPLTTEKSHYPTSSTVSASSIGFSLPPQMPNQDVAAHHSSKLSALAYSFIAILVIILLVIAVFFVLLLAFIFYHRKRNNDQTNNLLQTRYVYMYK